MWVDKLPLLDAYGGLLEQRQCLLRFPGGPVRPGQVDAAWSRVLGWSAPSFFTRASRTCSSRAMASAVFPAER